MCLSTPCCRAMLKSGELCDGNANGPRIDPWGRPVLSGLGTDMLSWITDWLRSVKYELSQAKASSCTPYIFSILCRSVSWLTVSNAALKSNMTRSTQWSSSIAQRKSLVILTAQSLYYDMTCMQIGTPREGDYCSCVPSTVVQPLSQSAWICMVSCWLVCSFLAPLYLMCFFSEGELHLPILVCEGNRFLVGIYSPRWLMPVERDLKLLYCSYI